MNPIYCLTFTFSLNDDVRDVLFETAYLMLRGDMKRKRVRSQFCEGIITNLGSVVAFGPSGVQFKAELGTKEGELQVLYMVRPQDLHQLEGDDCEHGAWLSPDEIINPPKDLEKRLRPNPIRRVAKKHSTN